MKEHPQTTQYLFSGRVQGVGFRWTTRRIAGDFAVAGYVKNLADGRVEMVAQGETAAIRDFADAVTNHFQQNLESTEVNAVEAGEEFTGFAIRR